MKNLTTTTDVVAHLTREGYLASDSSGYDARWALFFAYRRVESDEDAARFLACLAVAERVAERLGDPMPTRWA